MKPSFRTAPPATSFSRLSFPAPYILLVKLSRPKELNCINIKGHWELHEVFSWLDNEPSLRVGIVTGEGRAFCAGADLKEWNSNSIDVVREMPPTGFGGLSRRGGKKPIIAAVNGVCFGGGFEMIANCDLVLASPKALFALPEVKVGVVAIAGALPRLVRTIGRPRATEMALTGRNVSAEEAMSWGIVNKIAEDVVGQAVETACVIAENSPDGIIVSREGIKLGWEGVGVEEGTNKLVEEWYEGLHKGENMKEGLRAFVEKRKPRWVASKL